MPHAYHFHPQLILRTPSRPFDEHISEHTIAGLLHDQQFIEAVYLASPVLWAECQKWQRNELTDARRLDKLRRSLTKYYVRSTTRCTPFGLFAGCAPVAWGAASQLVLAPTRSARHTRLDMHYLCALAQHLAGHPALRPRLRYWPNTSLYAAGEEFRYIEYQYLGPKRVNQLSAVEAAPHVAQVLQAAQDGLRYPELLSLLDPGTGESWHAEATQFLDELVQAQLLVNELEPTVTGPEFFDHIQRVLTRLLAEEPDSEITVLADQLREVGRHLHDLDQAPVNAPARYEHVIDLLAALGVPIEAGKLFQTDASQGLAPDASTVDVAVQTELLGALHALQRLTPALPSSHLSDFTRRFQARYEEKEVPLLVALDNESGLSYTEYGQSTFSPLVHDLQLVSGTPPPPVAPGPAQQMLARKLRQALQAGQYNVFITDEDLHDCPASELPLPPSLAVMFRLVEGSQVQLESAGGSSAVNLLGRFAHANPAIERLVREVTDHEQAQNPAVAFAEICHLPASRVGNVLLRPNFRDLEIAYLAQASLPAEGQVRVQDLLVAVRDGQLILRSQVTGQRIVPRLSTAHNFTQEALPVYQFLCDLQTQGLQPHLGVSWPVGDGEAKFLPRLTYRRVVLAPATWQLEPADLRPLLAASEAELLAALANFRRQWQLPRWFVLAEGDNELLVDAENAWLVRVWIEAVRTLPIIQLKEFLFDPATSPVRGATGQPHTQQLVALLLRDEPCYAVAAPRHEPAADVPRSFALGSQWLYYKLYCGQKRADFLLRTLVQPLTEALAVAGLIDNWFFIRYADPDNHLRLRLHLPDPGRIGEVVQCVAGYLHSFQTSGAVWKVQTETYCRELERYGSRTIALTEQLFGWQSQAVLAWLDEPAPTDEMGEHWLWGLSALDELLDAFAYSLAQKAALLGGLRAAFAQEFGMNKALRLQLDAKYRMARPSLAAALAARRPVPPDLAALAGCIRTRLTQGPPEVALDDLLAAYLHMLLNRLLPTEARLHELVLYDFLHRHYQAILAQQYAVA